MTDAGWAGNKVSDAQRRKPRANMIEIADSVLQAEHARSVRIVKAAQRYTDGKGGLVQADDGEWIHLPSLLTALQRGRGKGGVK